MSKYIDKDNLMIRFEQLKKSADKKDDFFLDGVMAIIESQPPADVQPVRRGKWEHTCICSECGQIDYSMPNYCPNCGAYMKGEENE